MNENWVAMLIKHRKKEIFHHGMNDLMKCIKVGHRLWPILKEMI